MIDFHCHILPNIDDGSQSVDMSLAMLEESANQGIDTMVATPHFYAYEDSISSFLARRRDAYDALMVGMASNPEKKYPEVKLGAEVYYFEGMSTAEDLRYLELANTGCILIEPPMEPWTEKMFDEIERAGRKIGLVPVIAHVDRYMRILNDDSLINRVHAHRMLVQVNASYFLHSDTEVVALEMLEQGMLHLIGSDAHNLDTRAQNIGLAARAIAKVGDAKALASLNEKGYRLLKNI